MAQKSNLPADLAAARIINAAGTLTRLSGARVSPNVAAAMAEAAQLSFDMWALQAAASERIAAATGAEAALVTTGAAAGLTLAAAAAIAGNDLKRIDRLPDTSGIANEIVVPRTHRNAYDRALRSAGAVLVDCGTADRETDAGIRGLEAWEVESVIGPSTAAIAANFSAATRDDMAVLSDVARRYKLPLIVDAAAQLPPAVNLRSPFAMGATLVVYSGGKAIGGPQASGILAGRRDLVASAALQMLDMDVRHEAFWPPPVFFGNARPAALPRHGIGRGFKASKEAIVGLVVALDEFLARDEKMAAGAARKRLEQIATMLSGEQRVRPEIVAGRSAEAPPRLALHVAAPPSGPGAERLAGKLRQGNPRVFLAEGRLAENVLVLDLVAVTPEDDATLIRAIKTALG